MKKLALTVTLLGLGAIKAVYAAEFFCRSGDVTCLIAAINQANQNSQQNTINLEAGTYTLTAADNSDDRALNGLPLITGKMTIRGQSSSLTTIEGEFAFPNENSRFRIFRVEPSGVLNLESLAVRKGTVFSGGGGIIFNLGDLTIFESDISEGFAFVIGRGGGGILNMGNIVIRSSRIFDNETAAPGAGIRNDGIALIEDSFIFLNFAADDVTGSGGGIYNTGELNLTRTNIVNNHARVIGAGLANLGTANLNRVFIWLNRGSASLPTFGGRGGGIYNDSNTGLTILSSTIAENAAEIAGGGIYNASGPVTVTNSTIVGNRVEPLIFIPSAEEPGGIRDDHGQLEIQNSIVALNSTPTGPSDCSGSPVSLGRNIIGDISGCQIILRQTDLTGDPGLGDLVVEDPPGRGYFPLLPDSRAINAGNPDACSATDQLGLLRVGPCDIGSVEFQGKMLVSVDVRPRKDANRINPNSTKNINVAIFSANGFTATTVNANTVRFGATGFEAAPIHIAFNDVNGDGQLDMIARFQIQDTGIKCGDTSAILTGQISNGASIIGSSPITTVQCKNQDKGLIASGLSKK